MENPTQDDRKKHQPLMVYSRKRRRRIISQEDGESHTTASSNNGAHHTQSLSMNNSNNKAISVYSRRGRTRRRRSRKKADALEVKFEVEGPCVKSSDSPIDFTTVTEMRNGNSNNNNKEIEALGCCKTVERRHYELRSMVSRRAQSQLSTTAEHIKPEVSTVSDLTQVPTNKVTHRLQRTKSARRGHRKYLKYSTILRNTGLENCTAIITECGKDSDVYKEDEDYMGDQRKEKMTRTLESLYACSIITEDFCVKPWYLKYSTILKDTSYEDGNDKITEHGKDPVVYIEDEDYLGEERKQKVTRSVESLYTCPIATGIFA